MHKYIYIYIYMHIYICIYIYIHIYTYIYSEGRGSEWRSAALIASSALKRERNDDEKGSIIFVYSHML